MKIALCISGQPRFVKKGYKNLYSILLSKYNLDIFIHSWHVDLQTSNQLLNLYNPLSLSIEHQIKFPKLKYYSRSLPRIKNGKDYVYSMFYSIKQANLLKQNYENAYNFKYDIVIRSRFDLDILSPINLLEYDLNKIFTLGQCPYGEKGCNDNFAFSNSLNMDVYSNIFGNIDYLMETTDSLYGPEHLLKSYLDLYKLEVIDGNINHEIYK